MSVSREHGPVSRKRAYQHQQRRLGQMEVGEQHIHHLKAKARCNEEPRLARPGCKAVLPASERRRLERPYDRSTDRNHPAASSPRLRDRLTGGSAHRRLLRVQYVRGHLVRAQRLEGTRTHMQGNEAQAHSPRRERRHQRLIEVQACGRRCDRARLAREDALIALAIGGRDRAADVGRQRDLTETIEKFQRRPGNGDTPEFPFAADDAHRAACGCDLEAGTDRLARRELHQRLRRLRGALEKDFDAPAGGLLSDQTGGDDTRVVEHQQVASLELARQIAHLAVGQRSRRPNEHQHAPRRSVDGWSLSNELRWQLIGEILTTHRRMLHAGFLRPARALPRPPPGPHGRRSDGSQRSRLSEVRSMRRASWSMADASRSSSLAECTRSGLSGSVACSSSVLCWRTIRSVTFSPGWYELRIRVACEPLVGSRPSIERITSPSSSLSAPSGGARTTSTPLSLPK